jgi:uncharacterized protein (DUF2062 family)
MRRRLQQVLQILVHVDDTPHRIALAFAIGVFIAFSPLLGVHTGLALLIAYLFRLSRGPMLVGAYVNNPWTLAPLYMAGTLFGCFLLGVSADGIEEIDWGLHGAAFYRALFEGLRPYVWPFIIGNTVLGVVCGAAAYFALRFVLERRRQPAS